MKETKIKVAILGVGNCASSLVQGIDYYSKNKTEDGLISDKIGGYSVSDIEIVAAIDINDKKVGKDLAEAIFETPNNSIKFQNISRTGVIVNPGKALDGIGRFVESKINIARDSEDTENS